VWLQQESAEEWWSCLFIKCGLAYADKWWQHIHSAHVLAGHSALWVQAMPYSIYINGRELNIPVMLEFNWHRNTSLWNITVEWAGQVLYGPWVFLFAFAKR
jgi:hypothetical protein